MSCDFFLLRVNKVLRFYAEVFSEAYDINTLTMLWHTEIHGIYNLRVRHHITYFIKSVQDGFQSLTLIMNGKTFYVFKEESLWLLATKYFCNIEEECTTGFLETKSLAGKRKCLAWEAGT